MPDVLRLKNLAEPDAVRALGALGARSREARRIWSAVVRRRAATEDLARLEQVRRPVLDAVLDVVRLDRLECVARRVDPADGFTKYLFALPDGRRIETVRIPIFDSHYVVCVSCQVGCALDCAFCATGRMGLGRNLEAWEIVEQVLAVRDDSDRPVRGVVFMGMGEPLLAYEPVVTAARILSSSAGLAIGAKRITVSTAGWVPAIRRYTEEGHRYRLAVSLTSAIAEKRAMVMPRAARFSPEEVMDAVRAHALARRQRAMLAYVLIAGFNTSREDALALKRLVGDTKVMIDLIDVNDATGRFRPPERDELERFRDELQMLGQPVVRRYSGGKAVEAACGMLAATG